MLKYIIFIILISNCLAQKITIVPGDCTIIINGVPATVSTTVFANIDPTITAIQWNGTEGVAEKTIGPPIRINRSFILSFIDAWKNEQTNPNSNYMKHVDRIIEIRSKIRELDSCIQINGSNYILDNKKADLQNKLKDLESKLNFESN